MTIPEIRELPQRNDPLFNDKAMETFSDINPMIRATNAATLAMNLNSISSTSVTSVAIPTALPASKSMTVETGKSYLPGMSLKIARTSSATNWMHGEVTSYNSTTGALVVNVTTVRGSGTYTDWTITYSSPIDNRPDIQPIAASVASNALTLQLNPTTLFFRSATLTSGDVVSRGLAAAISLVVPSGATLGTANATPTRLVLLALDNSGTMELAVVNLSGGLSLDDSTLISTTAIGTGADASNVVYSAAARTNLPFRVVGFIDITEATAGTWATTPTTVQGAGGQAVSAMSGFGYGELQTPSRALGTTYRNNTGKPVFVSVSASSTANASLSAVVNGKPPMYGSGSAAGFTAGITFFVPPYGSYIVNVTAGTPTLTSWAEL